MNQLLLPLKIILVVTSTSYSQHLIEPGNKIQVEFGLSNIFNYNKPITFNWCEGCITFSQSPVFIYSTGLNYYRSIHTNHELEIGFGLSRFKTISTTTFPPFGIIHDLNINLHFYNFSIGHRYKLNSTKKLKPYVENNLIYEHLKEADYFDRISLAIKTRLGLNFYHNHKINFHTDAFFKSGFNSFSKNYIPFSYGLETGMSFLF